MPECWLWRNPAPGTLRCPSASAPLVHFCDFSHCYLSNFLPLLTSSQLRADSSKSLHLGMSPCPWVTPPPRPEPDSQTVTLLQCVEIADARTTLGSHAQPGRFTQPGSCCPGIVPPPLQLSTSYFTLSATPSSNLSSPAGVASMSSLPATKDKQESQPLRAVCAAQDRFPPKGNHFWFDRLWILISQIFRIRIFLWRRRLQAWGENIKETNC